MQTDITGTIIEDGDIQSRKINVNDLKNEAMNKVARVASDMVNRRQLTLDGDIPGGDLHGVYENLSTIHQQQENAKKSKYAPRPTQKSAGGDAGW